MPLSSELIAAPRAAGCAKLAAMEAPSRPPGQMPRPVSRERARPDEGGAPEAGRATGFDAVSPGGGKTPSAPRSGVRFRIVMFMARRLAGLGR